MNSFLQKLRSTMYRLSYGRYGNDEFSRFLLFGGLGLWVVSLITRIRIFYTFAVIMLFYNIFRIYSKNFAARRKELDTFLFYKHKFDSKFALQKRMWNERHTHKFFKCPKCKTVVRLPKGKGKIEITCPKCKTDFIKKT